MENHQNFVELRPELSRDIQFNVENLPAKIALLLEIVDGSDAESVRNRMRYLTLDEFGLFRILAFGINRQGNKYLKTGYLGGHCNDNTYYYLNQDGSFYVANPDSSEFYRHVDESEWYKVSPWQMRKSAGPRARL